MISVVVVRVMTLGRKEDNYSPDMASTRGIDFSVIPLLPRAPSLHYSPSTDPTRSRERWMDTIGGLGIGMIALMSSCAVRNRRNVRGGGDKCKRRDEGNKQMMRCARGFFPLPVLAC